MQETTKGWKLCILWKDGSTSWEPQKDLKESNHMQVAEYVVATKLVSEPAFAWWVPFTLKKCNRIIMKVNAHYLKKSHKFGIQIPKSVPNAMALDKANGNDYWEKAIPQEMDI